MKRREARLDQAEATRPTNRGLRPAPQAEDVRDEQRHQLRAPAPGPRTEPATPQNRLARLLSSHEGLRMVIVAREILGPPKALQRPEDAMLP
jgi:hypothetical protein